MKDLDEDHPDGPSAIFLSEYLLDINDGAGFLSSLSADDEKKVRQLGTRRKVAKGEGVFFQGDPHTGVWILEKGRVRTFYASPSGREITLAYLERRSLCRGAGSLWQRASCLVCGCIGRLRVSFLSLA